MTGITLGGLNVGISFTIDEEDAIGLEIEVPFSRVRIQRNQLPAFFDMETFRLVALIDARSLLVDPRIRDKLDCLSLGCECLLHT